MNAIRAAAPASAFFRQPPAHSGDSRNAASLRYFALAVIEHSPDLADDRLA
jgi:hypothetical protein